MDYTPHPMKVRGITGLRGKNSTTFRVFRLLPFYFLKFSPEVHILSIDFLD